MPRPREPRPWIQSDHVASIKMKNKSRHAGKGALHPFPGTSYFTMVGEFHYITLQRDKRGAGRGKSFFSSHLAARDGVSGMADYAVALVSSQYFKSWLFHSNGISPWEPCHLANYICSRPDFESKRTIERALYPNPFLILMTCDLRKRERWKGKENYVKKWSTLIWQM